MEKTNFYRYNDIKIIVLSHRESFPQHPSRPNRPYKYDYVK